MVEVSEAYGLSRDPFNGKRVRRYISSMIRVAVRGAKRAKVLKILLRMTMTSFSP